MVQPGGEVVHNSQTSMQTYQSIGSEPPDASVVDCGWRAAACCCSAERSRLASMSSSEEGIREISVRSSSGTSAEGREDSIGLPPAGRSGERGPACTSHGVRVTSV